LVKAHLEWRTQVMSLVKPDQITLPFAASGNKNTIPIASQIGITGGAASYTDGFPPLTMTPVAAGGIPPSGKDMNGVIYELSNIIRWLNAGGGFEYDSIFANDSNVDGYPLGAKVKRTDGTGYWLNTIAGNKVDPETSGAAAAGWVPDFTNGIATIAMSSSNVTLTPAEYGKPIIALTGTITANLNLIFPAIAEDWIVINKTSGAFTITCKTVSGVGVIAQSNANSIICDGIDFQAVSGTFNGRLLSVTDIIASGSYAKNSASSFIIVEAWGGGGGGGGVSVATAGCGGGGAGGYTRKKILTSALSATEIVTIGNLGGGGTTSGTNGVTGGTTSFGAFCSATGGAGGVGATTSNATAGGAGGSGSGGDINLTGQCGFPGSGATGLPYSFGGVGGTTTLGGNGIAPAGATGAGSNAVANSGSGGGGAVGTTANAGGNGGTGRIRVWEYS